MNIHVNSSVFSSKIKCLLFYIGRIVYMNLHAKFKDYGSKNGWVIALGMNENTTSKSNLLYSQN